MKIEAAPDVQTIMEDVAYRLDLVHVKPWRIVCMRSWGSKARAHARIWSLPKIWQKALRVEPHYVLEVLSEHYDGLSQEEREKTIIHELMHVPKTFSGSLVPHLCFGKRIDRKTVDELYNNYKASSRTRQKSS
jgi:predicted metallopeptidase